MRYDQNLLAEILANFSGDWQAVCWCWPYFHPVEGARLAGPHFGLRRHRQGASPDAFCNRILQEECTNLRVLLSSGRACGAACRSRSSTSCTSDLRRIETDHPSRRQSRSHPAWPRPRRASSQIHRNDARPAVGIRRLNQLARSALLMATPFIRALPRQLLPAASPSRPTAIFEPRSPPFPAFPAVGPRVPRADTCLPRRVVPRLDDELQTGKGGSTRPSMPDLPARRSASCAPVQTALKPIAAAGTTLTSMFSLFCS